MNSPSPKKILILAGEASGDLLAAHLCQAIQKKIPAVTLFGMGGKQMREAGVDILVDSDQIAVVGGLEILTHLSELRAAFKTIKQAIKNHRPDLVVLVDYPGFNLRMAKFAKKFDCKVLFYVSPQIWAWRYRRIHHIKKTIDHMAVLFSFEEAIYQKENVPVTFVGHPILDAAVPTISREKAYQRFDLNPDKPIIALFPGSRKQEVSRMLPLIMNATREIRQSVPEVQFVLPLANSLNRSDIASLITSDITVIEDNTYNVLSICTTAIAVSGTVTLEIALHRVPLVIIYKMAALSYWIAKRLIKTKYIGLCNIVAEDSVAKELIQNEASKEAIAEESLRLLTDPSYRLEIIQKMAKVRENLGNSGGSEQAASVAIKLLTQFPQ